MMYHENIIGNEQISKIINSFYLNYCQQKNIEKLPIDSLMYLLIIFHDYLDSNTASAFEKIIQNNELFDEYIKFKNRF